ncbi:unnamed protein product, partial [Polarella glacialis]
LGKTLQSVAVIWTLLTQGGPGGKPACRKALVVCPASLVKNWQAEFEKWLHGKCKLTACAVTGQAQVSGTFSAFKYDRESKVLIASYETFRGHAKDVADAGIDLIVCDEAHKLKNDEAATTKCIAGLSATRRLLISGTPIQNNLEEFFTLVSVANPGIFGEMQEFRRKFALPILRGREPTATQEERRRGEETLAQVSQVTDQFILRRTNRLNARFLPPKQLFNIFVMPTDFQRQLYRSFLKSEVARKLLEDGAKMNRTVLATIRKLQGLVNHPFLVRTPTNNLEAGFDDDMTIAMFAEIDRRDQGLRSGQKPVRQELSGKLGLVYQLLVAIKASGSGDRIVIISNWTSTLDIIEKMCEQSKWPIHRLDGTMAISKRMKLVTDFNRPENKEAFAFLLSSKAGGCGLNLIGANRLVMFDPDWNPANDRQAMARVWRDGQKKECFIYRLFTTGTIDEKVYQRQICKDGLSTMMVTETGEDEQIEMKETLAADLVKDLFCFEESTSCATHDMLGCKRCMSPGAAVWGVKPPLSIPQEAEVVEEDLRTWSHHSGTEGVKDGILIEAARQLTVQAGSWRPGQEVAPGVSSAGISFTMGCHIEFTPEQIAKLEEEDRVEQEKRKDAARRKEEEAETTVAAEPAAASSSTAPAAAAAAPAAVAAAPAAAASGPVPIEVAAALDAAGSVASGAGAAPGAGVPEEPTRKRPKRAAKEVNLPDPAAVSTGPLAAQSPVGTRQQQDFLDRNQQRLASASEVAHGPSTALPQDMNAKAPTPTAFSKDLNMKAATWQQVQQ